MRPTCQICLPPSFVFLPAAQKSKSHRGRQGKAPKSKSSRIESKLLRGNQSNQRAVDSRVASWIGSMLQLNTDAKRRSSMTRWGSSGAHLLESGLPPAGHATAARRSCHTASLRAPEKHRRRHRHSRWRGKDMTQNREMKGLELTRGRARAEAAVASGAHPHGCRRACLR